MRGGKGRTQDVYLVSFGLIKNKGDFKEPKSFAWGEVMVKSKK